VSTHKFCAEKLSFGSREKIQLIYLGSHMLLAAGKIGKVMLMASANQFSKRHHYIPKFYTALWCKLNGQLCQYSRPHTKVVPIRKYPEQVGYKDQLYSIRHVPDHLENIIEDKFLKKLDNDAAVAMRKLINSGIGKISIEERLHFSLLITGFFYRLPGRIDGLKKSRLKSMQEVFLKARLDPNYYWSAESRAKFSLDELERQEIEFISNTDWAQSFASVVTSEKVNNAIINMKWTLMKIKNSENELLTSDIPLISTNGFAHAGGHLCLALGPNILFIATNDNKTTMEILSQGENKICASFNSRVTSQAKNYVYGVDDSKLDFVERFLTKNPDHSAKAYPNFTQFFY
jgi:hypothetical protein